MGGENLCLGLKRSFWGESGIDFLSKQMKPGEDSHGDGRGRLCAEDLRDGNNAYQAKRAKIVFV